jgi:hypothetical protein
VPLRIISGPREKASPVENLRVAAAALCWEAIGLLGKIFAESVRDPVITSWRWSLGRKRQVALLDETGTDSSPDHHLRLLSLFGDGLVQSIGLATGWQGGKVARPGRLPYTFLAILVGSFVQNRL